MAHGDELESGFPRLGHVPYPGEGVGVSADCNGAVWWRHYHVAQAKRFSFHRQFFLGGVGKRNGDVIREVVTYSWEVEEGLDPTFAEHPVVPDSRPHQNQRSCDDARGQNDLLPGSDGAVRSARVAAGSVVHTVGNVGAPVGSHQHVSDKRVAPHGDVGQVLALDEDVEHIHRLAILQCELTVFDSVMRAGLVAEVGEVHRVSLRCC